MIFHILLRSVLSECDPLLVSQLFNRNPHLKGTKARILMFRMHVYLTSLTARTITFPSFTNLVLGWQLRLQIYAPVRVSNITVDTLCFELIDSFGSLSHQHVFQFYVRIFFKLSTLIWFGSYNHAIWLAYFNLKTSIHNNLRLFGWKFYILYNTSPSNSNFLIMM